MNPTTVINRFVLKPGQLDAFVAAQQAFATTLCQQNAGLLGGRMYRGQDGTSAVLLSQFDSVQSQEAIRQRPDFKAHLARIQPMVESVSPELFQEAYTTGNFR